MKKSQQQPVRLTAHARKLELLSFIQVCFAVFGQRGWDVPQIAAETNLWPTTVYRLRRIATRGVPMKSLNRMWVGTFQQLGYAAGYKIELTPCAVEVSLIEAA